MLIKYSIRLNHKCKDLLMRLVVTQLLTLVMLIQLMEVKAKTKGTYSNGLMDPDSSIDSQAQVHQEQQSEFI